jgi:hypothetical protein
MKKRGFLALALVMSAAGVASAFAPVPQEPAARPPARELAMPVAGPRPAILPPASTAEPASAPVVMKASVEIRQAPVPLLMKPRPPIEQPAADAAAAAPAPEVAAKASDAAGDGAAKAAIEADGYKGVKMLRQGPNGIRYAKAMRGTTEVALTVDAGGRVSLE